MLYELLSKCRNLRLTPVSIDSDGTVLQGGKNVTVTKGSTGIYTISLNSACQQTLFPLAITKKDSTTKKVVQATVADLTSRVAKVSIRTVGDVLADAPFDIFLLGSNGTGAVYGNVPTKVRVPMANPKMLIGYYDGANDVLKFGKNEMSVTKTGAGLYTITFKRPFTNTPYVVGICNSKTRIVEYATKSNSEITLEVVRTDTSANADAEVFILVLASMSKMDYGKGSSPVMVPFGDCYLNPFEISSAGAMTRGAGYLSCTKIGTGDYDLTPRKQNQIMTFALAMADGSANICGIDENAVNKFSIKAEGDSVVFGAEVGIQRGYPFTV